MFVTVIPILLTVYAFGRAVAFPSPSATHRHASVIIRDVCIIGGGSSGTYAAIGLRDKGKSVALIEAQSLLGGHTNTYTDPATSKKVDYGVIIFPNTSTVTSYFDRFNILLTPGNGSPSTAVENYYVDFRTGRTVTGYSLPDTTAAFSAYATQVAKYPFLNIPGWHLPDPVPEDLLTPFGDFVKKYQLDDAVSTINEYAQGFGDLLSIPTLYVLKYFNVPPVQAGASSTSLTTARHDNSELYEKAREELGGMCCTSSSIKARLNKQRLHVLSHRFAIASPNVGLSPRSVLTLRFRRCLFEQHGHCDQSKQKGCQDYYQDTSRLQNHLSEKARHLYSALVIQP